MNPSDLVLKGISQVIVSCANGLNIVANQIDSFVKNQSERIAEHEEKTGQPVAKLKKIDKPLPEPPKEPDKPAGDMKATKSSSPAPSQETKKSSQPVSEPPSKPASKPASKPTPKPTSKKKPKKKSKPRATSKPEAKTDTDKVFQIISQSNDGVNVDTISKETGFDRTKIYGIVARLKKQSKIKSPKMGFYKKA